MAKMGLNNSINVRLDPETRERLDHISEASGIKTSVLIRRAVDEYCERVERTGQLVFTVDPKPPAPKARAAS